MKQVLQHMKALVVEEEGATAIEYGLLAALIAGVIVSSVTALAPKVVGLYTAVNTKLP